MIKKMKKVYLISASLVGILLVSLGIAHAESWEELRQKFAEIVNCNCNDNDIEKAIQEYFPKIKILNGKKIKKMVNFAQNNLTNDDIKNFNDYINRFTEIIKRLFTEQLSQIEEQDLALEEIQKTKKEITSEQKRIQKLRDTATKKLEKQYYKILGKYMQHTLNYLEKISETIDNSD